MQESKYEIKKLEGRTEYYKDGKLHRDDDLPAIEYKNGSKYWYQNGERHRDNGPAIEKENGDKFWMKNGLFHRLNGPAVEKLNGYKSYYIEGKLYSEEEYNKKMEESKYEIKKLENRTEYYKDGKLHRDNDLPAYEDVIGNKLWYQNGKKHRDNGPSEEYSNGDKYWFNNGKLHRLNGPAVEWNNGTKYWYIEGKQYTEEEFNKIIGKKVEKKMNKETIMNTLQDRMEKAAYRSAGRNITKGIAKGIVAMLKDKGTDESTLAIISAFFETEFGESLIGMILGITIPQIPMINEDERAIILAEEFQVESASRAMDAILTELSTYIFPVISGVIEKIPSKKRVLKEDNEVEEEIVVATNNKASA